MQGTQGWNPSPSQCCVALRQGSMCGRRNATRRLVSSREPSLRLFQRCETIMPRVNETPECTLKNSWVYRFLLEENWIQIALM